MAGLLLDSPLPRTTYTVDDLIDQVRGDLGYRNSTVLADSDIIGWANEAQEKAALETSWCQITAIGGTTDGTLEYALPMGALSIQGVRFAGAGSLGGNLGLPARKLFVTNTQRLDEQYWNWRQLASGTPVRYYLRGQSVIGLFPTPNVTAPDNVTIYYTAVPPTVSAPEDQFYIPYGFQYLIKVHCKLRASEKDAIFEGGRRIPGYQNEWALGIQKLKNQVASSAEEDTWAVGEDSRASQGGYGAVFIPPFTSTVRP